MLMRKAGLGRIVLGLVGSLGMVWVGGCVESITDKGCATDDDCWKEYGWDENSRCVLADDTEDNHCECKEGYQDKDENKTCELACSTAACNDHGSCDDSSGTRKCTCDPGYAAEEMCGQCDENYQDNDSDGICLPACKDDTCSGHGDCVDDTGQVECTCEPGYVAEEMCGQCDVDYQDNDGDGSCLPACSMQAWCDHGDCDDSSGEVVCICHKGYAGPSCDGCAVGYSGSGSECISMVQGGFVDIPAGTFTMGSPENELGRYENETQHQVNLTRKIEMTAHEVSQEDFLALMGWNPSYRSAGGAGTDCGLGCPVEMVSWYDALAFANELSNQAGVAPCYLLSNVVCEDSTGVGADYMDCFSETSQGIESATVGLNGVTSVYDCQGYRLPTEAEWEHAARAGTTTAFYSGDIKEIGCEVDTTLYDIGWYCGNSDTGSGRMTHPCGEKDPNDWGLYDMSGNVYEWVWDWYDFDLGQDAVTDPEGPQSGSSRVARGGSCNGSARNCRCANRSYNTPGNRNSAIGLRLVRSFP